MSPNGEQAHANKKTRLFSNTASFMAQRTQLFYLYVLREKHTLKWIKNSLHLTTTPNWLMDRTSVRFLTNTLVSPTNRVCRNIGINYTQHRHGFDWNISQRSPSLLHTFCYLLFIFLTCVCRDNAKKSHRLLTRCITCCVKSCSGVVWESSRWN